jgi:hypothetical protein
MELTIDDTQLDSNSTSVNDRLLKRPIELTDRFYSNTHLREHCRGRRWLVVPRLAFAALAESLARLFGGYH